MTTTNAMRICKQAGVSFSTSEYDYDESDLSGLHAAACLGIEPQRMFKTLVAKGEKNGYAVFCIPVSGELDLKACARVFSDKRVELIPVKELLGVTGYLRGGCSPIGMKKHFPTFVDESAILQETVYVSAGIRGQQIILSPDDLLRLTDGQYAALLRTEA